MNDKKDNKLTEAIKETIPKECWKCKSCDNNGTCNYQGYCETLYNP